MGEISWKGNEKTGKERSRVEMEGHDPLLLFLLRGACRQRFGREVCDFQ